MVIIKFQKDMKIKLETALLAKELGFDWSMGWDAHYFDPSCPECDTIHESDIQYPHSSPMSTTSKEEWAAYDKYCEQLIARPEQELLRKWLRDVHDEHLMIEPYWTNLDEKPIFDYVRFVNDDRKAKVEYFDTYEDALESCLTEILTELCLKKDNS